MDNTRCILKDDRILMLETTFGNQKIAIANIHAPQSVSEKIQFYSHINNIIEDHTNDDYAVIVLGDFNSVLNNNQGIMSGEKHSTREVASLSQLITHLDLKDSWQILHPEEKQYTWNRIRPFKARRIDYLFISSGLTANIEQSEIISFPHSDHRAVTLTLVRHDYKRGPSCGNSITAYLKIQNT